MSDQGVQKIQGQTQVSSEQTKNNHKLYCHTLHQSKMSHKDCTGKNLLSGFHDPLVSGSLRYLEAKFKAWREDLQEETSLAEWQDARRKAQTRTANTHLKLFYDMISSCAPLLLQKKLKKCDSNIPDLCFKTGQYKQTFLHCVWECNEISYFIYTNKFCDHQL